MRFVDGLVKKDSEWNYRSVGGYLPTWRWWIVSKNGSPIKASCDFLDAYNGGNSLKFNGHLNQDDKQNIMLYSTHIPIYKDSFLNIAHKYGVNSKIRLGLFLDKKYQEVKEFQLNPSSLWKEEGFNLSELEGKIIYGIRLTIESSDKLNDFKFNLGQISIYDRSEHLVAPRKLEIRKKYSRIRKMLRQ